MSELPIRPYMNKKNIFFRPDKEGKYVNSGDLLYKNYSFHKEDVEYDMWELFDTEHGDDYIGFSSAYDAALNAYYENKIEGFLNHIIKTNLEKYSYGEPLTMEQWEKLVAKEMAKENA